MKLATKIFCGMGTLTVLIGILAAYLLTQMSTMNGVTSVLAERNVPVALLAGNVSTDTAEFRVLEYRFLLEQNQASQKDILERMAKTRRSIQDEIARLEQLVVTGQAAKTVQVIRQDISAYLGLSDEIIRLQQQGQKDAALGLIKGKSYEAYGKVDKSSEALVSVAEKNALKRGELGDSLYEKSHATGIGLTFFALVLAASSCLLIVRDTTKQLGKDPQELNSIAKRVVGGDYAIDDGSRKIGVFGAIVDMVGALKTHIERAMQESDHAREQSQAAHAAKNEAEAAQNAAQAKTKAILAAAVKLEEVSQIVSSASTQLSAQIEQSDRGAAQAAQRLAEAATAMNEMNATVQEVASNAAQASTASAETRQKAENGASIVQDSLSSIGRVQSVSVELKQDMAELNTHAQAISQIMSVISDIADQTNLLALNAAIEAARAGEAGRGFAVVADEVRKLAEKTMASTNDVGNAISAIQQSTAKSMDSMDNAVTQVAEATKFANASGEALKDILDTVTGTADQVNAIAAASEEQSAASEEINRTIVEVNDMAGQTATAMAEAAQAVTSLAAQAQNLTSLIQDMKQG